MSVVSVKASTINSLGTLYAAHGMIMNAEEMYDRVFRGKEKELGIMRPSALETIKNLLVLYTSQGGLAKVEAIYSRVLQEYKNALEPKHREIVLAELSGNMMEICQGKINLMDDVDVSIFSTLGSRLPKLLRRAKHLE